MDGLLTRGVSKTGTLIPSAQRLVWATKQPLGALHERLPELPVVPREKPHTGAAAQKNHACKAPPTMQLSRTHAQTLSA